MSSSQVLVPIALPKLPSGTLYALKRVFDLTPTEWVLLWDCRRDDNTLFGLDPRHITQAQRPYRDTLRERAFIYYSVFTGKWELTELGRCIVLNAPLVAQGVECTWSTKAEVVVFPTRT